MRILLLLVVLAATGCLRKTEFNCTANTDCGAGTCEPTGFCSFADSDCTDGRRYGDFAGSLSNQCVGGNINTDGGPGDTPMGDGGGGCPSNYTTLPNAGTHRYKVTSNAAGWLTQVDRCQTEAAGVYLAIPDNMAELVAIATAGGGVRTWVGLTDAAAEGTWLTVRGAAATYLPWDMAVPAQPDDANPGQDCASAVTTGTIFDDKCADAYLAVCECEP